MFARRQLLVQKYTEGLRSKSDDYSRFMLAVYEKRSTDDIQMPTKAANDDSENKLAGNPSAASPQLTGKWMRSEGHSTIDYTGKTQYGAGAWFRYEFLPDGTVEYKYDEKVKTIMQCDIVRKKSRPGAYSVSGDKLTIKFGEMSSFSSNSCNANENFDKKLPAEAVTLKWRIEKTEDDKPHLYLGDENGEFPYDEEK